MTLLTAPILKSSHIMAGNRIYFSKKRPKTNLKVFQYQISTSVKRLEKQLQIKANVALFLTWLF